MGAVVFHNFPDVQAKYVFINRNKTPFPDGFVKELKRYIYEMTWIGMSPQEYDWLKNLPFIRPTYAEWFRSYRFDRDEVKVTQKGGKLEIEITGPWFRTILWEVPLMALISELYFRMTGFSPAPNWQDRIQLKAKQLSDAGCLWSDFGTRRRFSKQVQSAVVKIMSQYKGFLGTSNPQLAQAYNVKPIGTSAHEAVMAMGALYSPSVANELWMNYWRDYYKGQLSIALTDTFTTDVFLKTFTPDDTMLWDGLRQDSGDPYDWARKVMDHYAGVGVDAKTKTVVFSDNLNVPRFIDITQRFKSYFGKVIGGIGTNFTNDVFTKDEYAKGARPLNMVIKLKAVKQNEKGEWLDAVKLSDDSGKHTGTNAAILAVKRQLIIP